jgi:L-fucose mutarotase
MLKNIPEILSPGLLKILMEMGHGDELVLCDGNYPRLGQPERVIDCDGHGIPELLEAILRFFPLDSYVDHPVILMQVLPGDPVKTPIWETYREIIAKYEKDGVCDEAIDKYEFYKRGARAYAALRTGEKAMYANVILKKGVVL